MPPLALAVLLNRTLPWLTVDGRAVINTLICDNGRVGSAEALCKRLGLRSRFQLNRLLRREGLPTYEELAGWVCVFYWMLKADAEGSGSLRALATTAHMDAASCYRLVRRVTGRCWSKLREAGTEATVASFLHRAQPRRGAAMGAARAAAHGPPVAAAADPLPPAQDRVVRVALDGGPYGVAVRGTDLAYVSRTRGAALQRLDLAAGRLGGSIPLGCTPTCIAFAPSGMFAYVSMHYQDEIAVIDTAQHRQTAALRVPGDPLPLLVSPTGRTLFVTTNEDSLVSLCPSNGRILGSLRLPATSHHLALHPAGGRLYVATRAAGSVLEVDMARLEVLRTFPLGGWPQGIVVNPSGTLLYCANEQHGLDVVRLATGKRIATLELLHGAVSLALTPDDRWLYAGLVHTGKIAVVDAATFEIAEVIETGGHPREFGFDRRGGRVIVPNEAGWIDLLPLNGRRVERFPQQHPPLRPPLAASAS